MAPFIPDSLARPSCAASRLVLRLHAQRIELVERALDLGLDVERLEALARAPFVARDDELANLRHQSRIVPAAAAPARAAARPRPRCRAAPRRGRPCARCAPSASGGSRAPARRGRRPSRAARGLFGAGIELASQAAVADVVEHAAAAEAGRSATSRSTARRRRTRRSGMRSAARGPCCAPRADCCRSGCASLP